MAVSDAHMFPGFLTQVLTQLFFPKPPTIFLTCFCRGERRKYARKKVCLNWGSNSQPPSHESDTLTTEPPRWGSVTCAPGLDRHLHVIFFSRNTLLNKLKVPFTTTVAFAASVDQDQTAQNVQPDLLSTLSTLLQHVRKK